MFILLEELLVCLLTMDTKLSDHIQPLVNANAFSLSKPALDAFKLLKKELEGAALQSIDESRPFVVECDASEVAISATLNQGG